MTMDIHLLITLPDDSCVTPNVPRIRASFFNRKYRDIQTTPTTPKVNHSRTKVTPSTTRGNRSKRPAGSSSASNSGRQRTVSPPYTGRPNKGRSSVNEPFDPDFSTPRATRNLLTPPSTNCGKLKKGGRITHLVYKPLELDNESSSESIDSRRKRKRLAETPETSSPLAIMPPMIKEDSSDTEIIGSPEEFKKDKVVTKAAEAEPHVESTVKVAAAKSESPQKKQLSIDEEPEIIEIVPDIPTFVPGNCNISDILKLFGKKTEGDSCCS